MDNFTHIRPFIKDDGNYIGKLAALEAWTKDKCELLYDIFRERKRRFYVRECHGDMHLGNIALHNGKLIIFDCIEFSEDLRWIDVISDIAFLIMDLESRNHSIFAHRFLNFYLQHTDAYDGLSLLRFYCVYRALVRCKVACLQLQNVKNDLSRGEQLAGKYRHYIDIALEYIKPVKTFLIITHGLSGSGKTTATQSICEIFPAIRIRSDIERKRLNKTESTAQTGSGPGEGIYTDAKTQQTYDQLRSLAETVLKADYPIIVDATFLREQNRRSMHELATRLNVPFIILSFRASIEKLHLRIEARKTLHADASEADTKVLEYQIKTEQPLDNAETSAQIVLNTDNDLNYQQIVNKINKKLEAFNIDDTRRADI
jgi:Uncharacterized protein conserved in bacteria